MFLAVGPGGGVRVIVVVGIGEEFIEIGFGVGGEVLLGEIANRAMAEVAVGEDAGEEAN